MDDNDDPTRPTRPRDSDGGHGPAAEEEKLEDETHDFGLFASMFRKKGNVSAQSIRKGTKDFECHGTRAQEKALEQSRAAMEDALSHTRVHMARDWARAWYFPDWWADSPADVLGFDPADGPQKTGRAGAWRWPEDARNRVVVVEGPASIDRHLGRVVTNQAQGRPARGKDWLLPEEALYLVERGSLDLWWPFRPLEDIMPAGGGTEKGDPDDFDLGVPLGLEAAYSLLIGPDGERGKISLRRFQVYANLRRSGYTLCRAPAMQPWSISPSSPSPPSASLFPPGLWDWLFPIAAPKPYGPLVRPGLYRSYRAIYSQLALVSHEKPSWQSQAASPWAARGPYNVCFWVWKPSTAFQKTRPAPPDYYVAAVDAQETSTPTLDQVAALLDSTPHAAPGPASAGPGRLYPRLKQGYRRVLVAVVDHGVINYMRFSEAAFGEELLFEGFDGAAKRSPKAWKKGGGSGGRGGSGRGRGRGRGGRGRGGKAPTVEP